MKTIVTSTLSLLLLCAVGCDEPKKAAKAEKQRQQAAKAPAQQPAAGEPARNVEPPVPLPSKDDADAWEYVAAAVGVGKKGRYGGDYLSTVVAARFRAEQTINFDRIPRAMQQFKALSPRGKGPKNHSEFMTEIIDGHGIRLPELPDGEYYIYSPDDETLYVARPKTKKDTTTS